MQRRGIVLLAVAALLVAALLSTMEPAHPPVAAAPAAALTLPLAPPTPASPATVAPKGLARELDRLFEACPGSPCVVVEAADGAWRIERNGAATVRAASVIKLPILLAVLALKDRGLLRIDDTVAVLPEDRTAGSGSLKLSPLPRSCRFTELLERMITESDNTAANAILRIVGFETIAAGFPRLGLDRTRLDHRILADAADNPTTAEEIAALFARLTEPGAMPAGIDGVMIPDLDAVYARALLRAAANATRLRRYLPDTVAVEHKTGTLEGVVHDAGILRAPGGDVIVAALVTSVRNKAQAEEWLGRVGRAVYDHESSGSGPDTASR